MVEKQFLILGIGNILWADEGFGVRVVEEMHHRYIFPDSVKLLDGGTQGIYLVDRIRETDVLVVFDAIDYGLEPGTMKLIEGDEVPSFLGAKKMSLHQTGFQEVLSLAQLMGDYPQHLFLVGVQPVELEDYGGSLREAVKQQMEPAMQAALNYLQQFGIEAQLRDTAADGSEHMPHQSLDIDAYERGRPAEDVACRVGDDRFLVDKGDS